MSHHADRTAPADVDTSSHRHLHVKSFAKMESPAQQRQQHEQHHQHQEQIPMCESPSPKIKRKIGNEELTSHRLIEKRRRDRMNSCLADLSRLIPSSYLKKGRGRVEKTEIVQMAIKYIRQLQQGDRPQKESVRYDASIQTPPTSESSNESDGGKDLYFAGYNECFEEAIQFLVERESFDPSRLVTHLRSHYDEASVAKVDKTSRSSILKAPRRCGQSSDSDYSSLQSDTSSSVSEWSSCTGSSKATSALTSSSAEPTPTNRRLNYQPCEEVEENVQVIGSSRTHSKEHRAEKRIANFTDDPKCQYKFKADMRDRFRYHQDSYWQTPLSNDLQVASIMDDEDKDDQGKKDQDWAWPNAPWPLKRRRHPMAFTDSRDTRAMPPPPPSSEMESLTSCDPMCDNIWAKSGKTSFGSQQRNFEREEEVVSPPKMSSHCRQKSEDTTSNLFSNLKHKSVPIFALHPLGSYYIPLVVNYGLLAPFLTILEEPRPGTGLTLHPVSISVNFCTKPVIHMPAPATVSAPTSTTKTTNLYQEDKYNCSSCISCKNNSQQQQQGFETRANRNGRNDHRCNP